MQKIPMTVVGHDKLSEELNHLKSVERPAVIEAIATARALGDLSENAEYHAAKDKQGFIEARIKQIEGALSLAEVIDPKTLSGSSVKFGATLNLLDEDTEAEITYQIVGDEEADVKSGKISLTSPIARSLIGKEQGDSVEVKTPGGQKFYEILAVEYK